MSFNISYWDLIKFPYFADTTKRGDNGWKQAQRRGEDRVTFIHLKYNMSYFQIGVQFHILVGVENHLLVQKMGQSEPAPTSAPIWMDGALMGAPFSSLLVPGLTKVGNSSWPFIFLSSAQVGFLWELFFSSPLTLAQVSLTYLHLDYLAMHPSLLPPHLLTYLPTYPPIYLPIHPFSYLPNNLPTYVLMH